MAYAMGGLPAARLLRHLGFVISSKSVLRRLCAARERSTPDVRILGVDDWAWRKGLRYGTMLVDLERNRVIDLLPVCSSASFAAWLANHPTVEVIARDRSQFFAHGGRAGAPTAIQVHDRYHLVSSLRDAVEREAHRLQSRAHAELAPGGVYTPKSRRRCEEVRRLKCREARYQRYLVVVELGRQGMTQLAIADKVGMDPGTVAIWLGMGRFPERRIRSDRQRDNARLQEAVARGCPSALRHFSAGRVASLLVRPPASLSEQQKTFLGGFLRLCPAAHRLRRMVFQFQALLRWRRPSALPGWIDLAQRSGFESVAEFARALRRDWLAVNEAASAPWSNGPVEGQINRLKAIKRQMYGRAGFALLRVRVLPLELEGVL